MLRNTRFGKTVTDETGFSLRESAQKNVSLIVQALTACTKGHFSPEVIATLDFLQGVLQDIDNLFLDTSQRRIGLVLASASTCSRTGFLLKREPMINPAPYDPFSRINVIQP